MKNIIKKNQIILFTVALMLIVAGYMNYNSDSNNILASTAITDSEIVADIGDARLVSGVIEENNETTEQTVAMEDNKVEDEYFVQSRIDRDKMYSQMIEAYEKILNNENLSEEQKSIASNEIKNINNRKNSIMICENLIKNKDIEDAIIFINDKSVNIIVKKSELTQEQVSQIQNIIQREMGTEAENIHISNKS